MPVRYVLSDYTENRRFNSIADKILRRSSEDEQVADLISRFKARLEDQPSRMDTRESWRSVEGRAATVARCNPSASDRRTVSAIEYLCKVPTTSCPFVREDLMEAAENTLP